MPPRSRSRWSPPDIGSAASPARRHPRCRHNPPPSATAWPCSANTAPGPSHLRSYPALSAQPVAAARPCPCPPAAWRRYRTASSRSAPTDIRLPATHTTSAPHLRPLEGRPTPVSVRSEARAALLHDFLDLLLADPADHVVVHVHQSQVHLVVLHRGVPRRIDDGVDGALHHEIGADLLAHRAAGRAGRVQVLVLALAAHAGPLVAAGHELHLAGIDQLALDVIDEGRGADVLGTQVVDLPHDHGRGLAAAHALEIAEPGLAQHLVDHLLGGL